MHGPKRPLYLITTLLFAGTLFDCDCETTEFFPAATYRPDGQMGTTDLIFGEVSVNTEKTIPLLVDSNGSAPLAVIEALLDSGSQEGTWRFEVAEELDEMVGLRPGSTATISVTFRPCPDAWEGNTLKDSFDFNTCPGDLQAGDLNITDNTRDSAKSFGLSGQPVQPPVASVWCPVANDCGNSDPQFRECNGITFGSVSAGETPCDLVIEVRNEWRNDKPVGTLEIERMEVLVQDFCCGEPGPIVPGEDVGFELQTLSGGPLNPNSGDTFDVEITPGSQEGATQFKFVFTGARTGIWRGQAANMTGLRLTTNDPNNRLISVPLTAQGSAPELACTCDGCDYGPVEQGLTRTATVSCRNGGDAPLTIANIAVESGSPEFEVTTDLGPTSNITLNLFEQVTIFVDYTPANTGIDLEILLLNSNDPINPRTELDLRGGAIPEIEVQPSDVLVFPFDPDEEPPIPPKVAPLTISNVGFGDLQVSEFELCGPQTQNSTDCNHDHPSVDDFTVEGCAGMNPCPVNLTLCAPGTAGCGTGHTTQLDVTYDNNDISMTDIVELRISSDDPTDPEHIVVLQAADTPCLFPTPVITIETNPACTNAPVNVNAMSSSPGAMDATITECEWFWLFTPSTAPPFNTQGLLTNSFVPEVDGSHVLGLHCTNSCGATSQSPAQETILVSDQCGN